MSSTREVKFGPMTGEENAAVDRIVDRMMSSSMSVARRNDPWTQQDIMMDVRATHCNGCPLRLVELADADDFNFAHDLLGIR